MQYFWPLSAVVVALAIVGIVLGVVLTRGSSKPAPLALKTAISWPDLPGLQTGKPPWPNNSVTLSARVGALGLNPGSTEQLAFHIHAHLDLFVDGQRVTIPRYIGIAGSSQSPTGAIVTELHTHQADGILHVESPTNLRYLLGQLFGEWGVRLTKNCVGSYKGSCGNLKLYVDGVLRPGNPANLVLRNHQEIAIVKGKPPATIPKSFDFAAHGV